MGSALSFDNQRWNVLITKYLQVFYMMCTCTCTGMSMGKGVQLMVRSICWTAVLRYCDHIRGGEGGTEGRRDRLAGGREHSTSVMAVSVTHGHPNGCLLQLEPPQVICTEQALPPPPDLRIVWLPWEHNQWAINSLGIRATCTVYQQPSNMGERRREEGGE